MAAATKLSSGDRRLLVVLGLPSLGLALAVTTAATYLPVLASEFTSSGTVIGLLIGAEGLIALSLPLFVGPWSDRVRSRFGRRRIFLIVSAPVAAVGLVLMPLAGSLLLMAGALLIFYVAYFTYYAPYRALFPDLVAEDQMGRAQSAQGVWREVGLGGALVGGGLLLALWRPLPFLLAAAVLLVVTAIAVTKLREPETPKEDATGVPSPRETLAELWALAREHQRMRLVMLANGLWEFTLGGLRAFVVLFFVAGLGESTAFASAVLAVVAVGALAAALIAGPLADRFGPLRVVSVALWIYGFGLLVPLFSQSLLVVGPVLPFIAIGGAVVMTLPYQLMAAVTPDDVQGAGAGLFEFSRGTGTLLGPLVTGIAIDASGGLLPGTNGYAAMFPVAALAILLSIPVLRRLSAVQASSTSRR